MTNPPASRRVRFRLVQQERVLHLLPGTYVIGRAGDCHLVIDDPSVSRRHACLSVRIDGASVEDLGSVNGVYINGDRIASSEPLQDGDSLIIGDRELAIRLQPESTLPPPCETLPEIILAAEPPPRPVFAEPPPSTERANALDLLGTVAERAIAAGQPEHAEHAVQARLEGVIAVARKDPIDVAPEAALRATTLALALARALRARRWLEYAVELLALASRPCSESLAQELRRSWSVAGPLVPSFLDAYTRSVAVLPPSPDKARTLALIDELRRCAAT